MTARAVGEELRVLANAGVVVLEGDAVRCGPERRSAVDDGPHTEGEGGISARDGDGPVAVGARESGGERKVDGRGEGGARARVGKDVESSGGARDGGGGGARGAGQGLSTLSPIKGRMRAGRATGISDGLETEGRGKVVRRHWRGGQVDLEYYHSWR